MQKKCISIFGTLSGVYWQTCNSSAHSGWKDFARIGKRVKEFGRSDGREVKVYITKGEKGKVGKRR